ncbi:oligosaccharide flippase family protein, partial [Hellea sp.]|nr:oligosaccharide flippase family protein [Hellea sp.]
MKRQIFGYIPVNIANLIVSFGTIVILTRLLEADEFGRYALAIALLYFVHMSLFTWVEAAMSRFYARAEQDGNLPTHIKTLYAAALMMIILCLPLLFLILYSLPIEPQMRLVLTLALVNSGFNLIYNIGREAHKAAHRIARFSILQTGNSLCGFAIGVLLVLGTPLREAGPFVGLLIAVIVTLLIDLPFMLSRTRSARVDRSLGKKYFLYGLPICFSLLLSYALSQGDLFFIKYFMGDAAVGG